MLNKPTNNTLSEAERREVRIRTLSLYHPRNLARWMVEAEAERDELRAENATMRDTLAHATRTYAANVDELRAEQSKWRSHLDAVLTFAGCDHDSRGEEGECVGCAVRGDAYNALRVAYGLGEVDQPADDVQSLIEVKAERDELRAALTEAIACRECKATRERLVYRAGKDAALTNEGAPE